TLTAWQLTAGGLLLVPVALLVEGPPPALDGRAVGGYLYLGVVGTATAYWLWFRGISRLPATSVSFLALLSPPSAAIIGWAARGQALAPLQLVGMALALGGTLAGQTPTRRRPETAIDRRRPETAVEPQPDPATARTTPVTARRGS